MNFKVIKQLYKKEILDVLRDKKTIIMMVIVPLLIYPLMFVGGMVMMSKVTTQMDTQTYEIAVDFMDTNPELVEMFLHPDDDTLHFKLCDLNVMDADISMKHMFDGTAWVAAQQDSLLEEERHADGNPKNYFGSFEQPRHWLYCGTSPDGRSRRAAG